MIRIPKDDEELQQLYSEIRIASRRLAESEERYYKDKLAWEKACRAYDARQKEKAK